VRARNPVATLTLRHGCLTSLPTNTGNGIPSIGRTNVPPKLREGFGVPAFDSRSRIAHQGSPYDAGSPGLMRIISESTTSTECRPFPHFSVTKLQKIAGLDGRLFAASFLFLYHPSVILYLIHRRPSALFVIGITNSCITSMIARIIVQSSTTQCNVLKISTFIMGLIDVGSM